MAQPRRLSRLRLLMFVDDIYEDLELWYPRLRMIEAGAHVTVAGPQPRSTRRLPRGTCGRKNLATESTVLGPFHMVASPPRELGDSIDLVATGQPCVVTGRVVSLDGTPLPGAQVDVWQADDHGFYDVQQPGEQPPGNGRGLFACDGEGGFWFRTVTPSAYPIPTDGPVGDLLTATGRHPYRPAHLRPDRQGGLQGPHLAGLRSEGPAYRG